MKTSTVEDDKHVGILAMEVYTPRCFVKQSALEEHNGVPAGKYTVGLGQDALGLIAGDVEDINSICLTVVYNLLEKYQIDPQTVGRLEVGTETLVDKSKSTKTVLMQLFPDNPDMEGATVINACYGGTSALLNAFYWCESSSWNWNDDGPVYAIVVAADIAVYDKGPARPTSGAGAVAFLVGRDAPLAFQPQARATHAQHTWDFFKPNPSVEYPTVNGQLSQVCYYQALEGCYQRFCDRMDKIADSNKSKEQGPAFDATKPDYFVFHSPYNKLVQKSYGRLFLMDQRRRHQRKDGKTTLRGDWLTKPIEETYEDKELEKTLKQLSKADYEKRLKLANSASVAVGNTYASSVFLGLASLVDGAWASLTDGKSIVMFSYGSGAMATMYTFKIRDTKASSHFSVQRMADTMKLTERLATRVEVHPAELDWALETRAKMHQRGAPYQPIYPTIGRLFPGTYYLNSIDSEWRRTYSRVPTDDEVEKGEGGRYVHLAPRSVRDEAT